MTPASNKNKAPSDYQQAEKMIDKTISEMEENTHIEYGSTIERRDKPSRFKWLNQRMKRLFKRR